MHLEKIALKVDTTTEDYHHFAGCVTTFALYQYGFYLHKNFVRPSEVCPFSYDCLDVPDKIFAEYGRGTCPKSMRNGQTCSPKCSDSRAVSSGTFRCYRGHLYNSFRCHSECDVVLSMEKRKNFCFLLLL